MAPGAPFPPFPGPSRRFSEKCYFCYFFIIPPSPPATPSGKRVLHIIHRLIHTVMLTGEWGKKFRVSFWGGGAPGRGGGWEDARSVWMGVWSGRGEALSVRPEAGQLPQRGSQVGVRCLPRAFHYKAVVGSSGKLTCLSLWERWHGEAVTERVSLWTLPSIGRPLRRGGYQPPGPRNSRPSGGYRSRSLRGLLPQSPPPAATAPSKREPKRTRRQGRGRIPFPPFDLLRQKIPALFSIFG